MMTSTLTADDNVKATPIEEQEVNKKKPKLSFKFATKFRNLEYPDWFTFYAKRSYFAFRFSPYSYFDSRPQLSSNITSVLVIIAILISIFTLTITWFHLLLLPFLFYGWGDFYLRFPFDTGKKDECEHPDYGFYVYHVDPAPGEINFPTCFIWQWNNYNSIDFPWARTFIRHSIFLKNGLWEHEGPGNHKGFYNEEWKDKQYMVEYDFTDKYDNTVIPAKVYIEEREWRQHWMKWTGFNAHVKRVIDIHFSKEVGSRKGGWKGGVVGCSYPMKKGESALDCIKRMEQERTFR
jgi:hypothetical protein